MTRFVGLDLSFSTGIVILDSEAKVITAKEIQAYSQSKIAKVAEVTNGVIALLEKDDIVILEGFAYDAVGKSADTQYGIGWIIRAFLYKNKIKFSIASPSQLKKFASGKGNATKEQLIKPIEKKWSFYDFSDNVRDAYVLARIAYSTENHSGLRSYEQDVLRKILKPQTYRKEEK